MRYLLLIHSDDEARSRIPPAEMERIMAKHAQLVAELEAAGAYVGCGRLSFASAARTVRVRDGQTLVTDGPFAETKEQLGGYYLIDARDLDEAIAWAAKIPACTAGGSVEVRPVWA